MNVLGFFTLNTAWFATQMKAAVGFRRALRHPRKSQEAILSSILQRNTNTAYGRRHGFHRVRSVSEYQKAVPIIAYNDLTNETAAIKRGEAKILTEEPLLAFEKTSGSTAAAKYIPYTAQLLREFQTAIGPWMVDLYSHRPEMLLGGAYWSISPLASQTEVTECGFPVGFENDTEYFGRFGRRLLCRLLVTPSELAKIPNMEACRYTTLRFLLATSNLSFISVWNPSFLTLLIRALAENVPALIRDIQEGSLNPPSLLPADLKVRISGKLAPLPRRARQLQGILRQHGTLPPSEVWPRLKMISCWANAGASLFVPELRRCFPGGEIQPKGLLATEGVVSIPLTNYPGAALAVTSHFLEFLDEANPDKALLVDELSEGSTYSVVLTTGGGLYRYRLGDRVRVVGRVETTPLVEFVGRSEDTSDLCGEKLHETSVRLALNKVLRQFRVEPKFAMLAPEWGTPPSYVLFLEADDVARQVIDAMAARLEEELSAGPHYAYCRRLGQLGELRCVRITSGGSQAYIERCARMGQRPGSIKATALHRRTGWSDWFHATSFQSVRAPET